MLEKYDLHNHLCFVDHYGVYHGLSKSAVHELFRTADLYVDLEWAQWKEESTYCKMRVFVDGEPGWFQVRIKKWVESGVALPAYDHFFTDGNLIGTEQCDVPTSGIEWKHNLPPVLLQEVKNAPVNGGSAFTTVIMQVIFFKQFFYNSIPVTAITGHCSVGDVIAVIGPFAFFNKINLMAIHFKADQPGQVP